MNRDWFTLSPLLLESIRETLYLVSITLVAGGLFGLVFGVLLYATRKGNLLENTVVTVLNIAVNIVRPIPFIIFITAVGPLTLATIGTTIGNEAVVFAMSIMASFVTARIVEQNLVATDPGVIEAARAMGASRLRIILTVLIPEALAPLILGYTFLLIGIVDMSALAGYVGGGGLGNFAIVYGYQRFNWGVTLVTVLVIIALVQLAQLLGNWLARKALHR